MKLLFTFTLLFTAALCFAQRQNVYYFKNDGRSVQTRDSADYIRIVNQPDSGSTLYNVFEFYANGVNKLTGKSTWITPILFQGPCITYFPNGKRQSLCTYNSGIMTGIAYEFYPNGQIYLVVKIPNKFYDPRLITSEYDSLGTPLIIDGNGYHKQYDEAFKNVTEEGNVKNGSSDGYWKGHDTTTKCSYTEFYDKEILVKGVSKNEKGDTVSYKSRFTSADFKGGQDGFSSYIQRNKNENYFENGPKVIKRVGVRVTIDKDGIPSHVEVTDHYDAFFDKEAINLILHSPKWIPATRYGINVPGHATATIDF